MSTYAIGDVQGCLPQLRELLNRMSYKPATSKLVFVGDLVNRGPESLETLRFIRGLGDSAIPLLGNHDLHLLAAANGISKLHQSDTLSSILAAPDRDDLLNWLRRQPLAHFQHGHLLVHAGVLPQWTAKKTLALANEVENQLRGPDWIAFLRNMFGNMPARWNDALEGVDRWRCIINGLTRVRFCATDGTMEFSRKGNLSSGLPGHLPWFDLPERKTENVTMVFGHWSELGLMLRPNLIALDTGCVWGGQLTAIRLEDRALFQVDCPNTKKLT